MSNAREFHHNKIINIAAGIVAYGTATFIGACIIMIIGHVIEHGAPSSFGIYG